MRIGRGTPLLDELGAVTDHVEAFFAGQWLLPQLPRTKFFRAGMTPWSETRESSAHKHDLVLGSHSVHTTAAALRDAQANLSAIRTRLVQEGRL